MPYPSLSITASTTKTVVETEGGVVAAQHSAAARIGAEILAAGGDAIDAAVAVSFAIGQREPWMSGPAGGGAMMVWRADEARAYAVNYGMQSPGALNPADFPLAGTGKASDLFPWEAVVGDRNVEGATAVAVPGVVAGAGIAHERWGRMPWADLLAPAIAEAKAGLPVDWYATLLIAGVAKSLSKDPDCAARFLDEGKWPPAASWVAATQRRLDLGASADTLATIAADGWQAFYGDIGEMLAGDVQAKGGSLSAEDMRGYRASIEDALTFPYRGGRFHVTPTLTAGPTFRHAMGMLEKASFDDVPDESFYPAFVGAMKSAYDDRLTSMGDENESAKAPACTTHFSIVDRQGNMVAMTQTLLSIFGSRVVSPSTGLLLNNGVMWFDPEPGKPNSLAPGKRCLMNVCPVIGETADPDGEGARFAFGASGGRKIVGAVAQLSSYVTDFGMSVGEAFHAPRLDVSGGEVVTMDPHLPKAAREAVAADHPVQESPRGVYPLSYACPAGVLRARGRNSGCTEIMTPWGDAIPEGGPEMLKEFA